MPQQSSAQVVGNIGLPSWQFISADHDPPCVKSNRVKSSARWLGHELCAPPRVGPAPHRRALAVFILARPLSAPLCARGRRLRLVLEDKGIDSETRHMMPVLVPKTSVLTSPRPPWSAGGAFSTAPGSD